MNKLLVVNFTIILFIYDCQVIVNFIIKKIKMGFTIILAVVKLFIKKFL